MSFKLNDYNTYLTSLFDKDTAESIKTPNDGLIPLNFDFGLVPKPFVDSTVVSPLMMGERDSYNFAFDGGDEREDDDEESEAPLRKVTSLDNIPPPRRSPRTKKTPARTESQPSLANRPRTRLAHNIIEQRYRDRISDQFMALQMSVPTLRVATKKKRGTASEDGEDEDSSAAAEFAEDLTTDLEGLEPARKLNKGTILTKLIEYIKFLELKNDRMRREHDELVAKAKMLGLYP